MKYIGVSDFYGIEFFNTKAEAKKWLKDSVEQHFSDEGGSAEVLKKNWTELVGEAQDANAVYKVASPLVDLIDWSKIYLAEIKARRKWEKELSEGPTKELQRLDTLAKRLGYELKKI